MSTTTTTARITVDEFENFDLYDDNRVELIDGEVIRKDEMRPAHVLAVELVKRSVGPMLPARRFIRKDGPVRIPNFNEPLPDITVAHGEARTYADHHPGPEDISLVIEVSDTTLAKDRGPKWEAYGRADIPVYWIVNLVDRQVEVSTLPAPHGYRARQNYRPGETLDVVIDGTVVGSIAVDDILPGARPEQPRPEGNGA
jgi:Uma2 family endonuclease